MNNRILLWNTMNSVKYINYRKLVAFPVVLLIAGIGMTLALIGLLCNVLAEWGDKINERIVHWMKG